MLKVNQMFVSFQGEAQSIGLPMLFLRFAGCNLACQYCFDEDTMVMLPGYKWKKIGDIEAGEFVMGLDECNRLIPTEVLNTVNRIADNVVLVQTDKGIQITTTANHKFYFHANRNREISKLLNFKVRTIGVIRDEHKNNYHILSEFQRGWLAGMIWGDGCVWTLKPKKVRRIRLAVKDNDLLDNFKEWSSNFGFEFRKSTHRGKSNFGEYDMNCLYLTVDAEAKRFEREIMKFTENSPDFLRGYLAGMVDAEGSISDSVRIYQNEGSEFDKICIALDTLKMKYKIEKPSEKGRCARIIGPIMLTHMLIPWICHRKINSIKTSSVGAKQAITNILPQKNQKVHNITTGTHNYVAEGFLVKNCDTDFESYKEFSVSSICDIIAKKNNGRAKIVSLTGGEPLLQNSDELFALMNKLYWDSSYKFVIETNATLPQNLNQLLLLSNYELPEYVYTINADIKTDKYGNFMHGVENNQLEFFRLMSKYFHNNTLKIVITPEMVDYENNKTSLYNTFNKVLNFFSEKNVNISLTPATVDNKITAFKTEDLFNIYEQVQRAVNSNSVIADIRIIPQMHVMMQIP